MSLVRWDPFTSLEENFNRLMPSLFGQWPRVPDGENGRLSWRPSADISETEKEFLIRAELPAVKKEDVKVTVDEGIITIAGERKQEKEDKSAKLHRIERIYGHFERSFSLPENVDTNSIRCENSDGVLTVHLPKTKVEKSTPKQIKVE